MSYETREEALEQAGRLGLSDADDVVAAAATYDLFLRGELPVKEKSAIPLPGPGGGLAGDPDA